jgi:hypothetical protein
MPVARKQLPAWSTSLILSCLETATTALSLTVTELNTIHCRVIIKASGCARFCFPQQGHPSTAAALASHRLSKNT